MKKIVLASISPRRRKLLKILGLDFEVVKSNLDEKLNPRLKPENQPAYLSLQKAKAVAGAYKHAIIIGADSMVLFKDKVIGKPKDKKEAMKMLEQLSNSEHSIITGFSIIDTSTQKVVTRSIETKVWFRKISKKDIIKYIDAEKPFDKAGAYAIQGLASIFVKKIDGDYFGALGLPLFALSEELKKFGIEVI
jgi:septum formation protein